MRRRMLTAAIAVAAAVAAGPSAAVAAPVTARTLVHFDLAQGQLPENVALGPAGAAYVTFAAARQVAVVGPTGTVRILATLPAPADGGAATPVLKFALTTGIVRTGDGTLYFLYASGDAATTGLYRLRPGQSPRRITALPATGLPNGLAYDPGTETFYLTDSVLGTVSAVPLAGGPARLWSSAPELAATGFLGANGIKVHRGAVWVSNMDQGTLLRIPLRDGSAGPVRVQAVDLAGIDDFAFAGDHVIAARNAPNTVVSIDGAGRSRTLLSAADGLQNPTSVAVRGRTLLVLSAAYTTATDPHLTLATVARR